MTFREKKVAFFDIGGKKRRQKAHGFVDFQELNLDKRMRKC